MSSCCNIIVFFVERESDSVLGYHMGDADFCCCPKCMLYELPEWLKSHFMSNLFYNIEFTITHDFVEQGPIGNEIVRKIIEVVQAGYTSNIQRDILKIKCFKTVHVVKQLIPWQTCKKTTGETKPPKKFSAKEIQKMEDITGLAISQNELSLSTTKVFLCLRGRLLD